MLLLIFILASVMTAVNLGMIFISGLFVCPRARQLKTVNNFEVLHNVAIQLGIYNIWVVELSCIILRIQCSQTHHFWSRMPFVFSIIFAFGSYN